MKTNKFRNFVPELSTIYYRAMETSPKGKERNGEIVTFFYAMLSHGVRQGIEPDLARKEAYDAVSLRYGIGKGRLLNIISEQNNSQRVNRTAFRENVLTLIDNLVSANEELASLLGRNEALITLLKDCLDSVDR